MFYAFEVYKKRLFPYYETIRRLNPSKTVYVTEDNVGLHHKARRLMDPLIRRLQIMFLDMPANSPDLHPIEHLHKDEKQELEDYRSITRSQSKASRAEVDREIEWVWCQSTNFNDKMAQKADISYYKGLASRSKASTPAYSNRYKDSL